MDKREMEKLMDKYKAEMLEFSKRNNVSGYPKVNSEKNDKREQEMYDALQKDETFERDRSDPLSDTETDREVKIVQAVPMQKETTAQNVPSVTADAVTDGAQVLRNSCVGVNDASTAEQKARCREISEFLAANPDSGTLKVETYASDRAFGVGSARVMVFLELPSGNIAVFDGLTDIDGVSDTVRLPAPPRNISQSPQTGNNQRLPYAVYSVYVEHPSFVRALFTNVPVFSGTESVQPVRMLAKAEGLQEPEPIVVDENTVNTLR